MILKSWQKHFGSLAMAKAMLASAFILFVIAISTAHAGSCDIVRNGLVACYPFNGNANDESGNGNNGTVNGATLTADRSGTPNSAYSFDGIGNYIEVQDSNVLHLTNAFTISVWIKQYGATILGYRIVDKTTANFPDGYNFDTYDGKTGHRMRLTGINSISANTVYSLNEWHHLVVVFSNGISNFYLDGVHDGSGDQGSSSMNVNNLTLRIGMAHPSGADPDGEKFYGVIDDIAIYNRAITETEIQQLYNPCYTQAQLDAAKLAGIQSCKDNPAGCSLFSQTQIDAAKQDGINLVKANPADYQLVTQAQSDQAVKTEQLKWDANGDGRIGLEDIVRMLQVLAGLRP